MRHNALLIMMTAALAAGCDTEVLGPEPSDRVASVTVDPAEIWLTVGESRPLNATVRATDGRVLKGPTVTWHSSDSTTLEITPEGLATARAAGTARVSATSSGKRGEGLVLVATPEVVSVDIDHASAALEEGDELQLTATPRDAQGEPIAGLGFQWRSSAPEIAAVGPLGAVIAIRPGTTTITVRVHGQEASVPVTVSASYAYDLLYTSNPTDVLDEIFRLDVREAGAVPGRLFPPESWGAHPVPSPDGTRIAFGCLSTFGDLSLCVANRDGSDRTMIAWQLGESFSEPTWSSDGSRLAYVRTRYETNTSARSRIEVAAADGSNPVSLTSDMSGNQTAPAWSPPLPDGSERIAFTSGSNPEQRIWTMRSDGSDKRQITSSREAFDSRPAWSPDGQMIAFQRIGIGIHGDLWVVHRAGGDERPLSGSLPGPQYAPAWSPDGRLVAFASSHETYGTGSLSYQIYTVWADGSKLARRTFDEGNKADPAWLPRH